VDVRNQMLILGMKLVVKNLDDVSHGDDTHELLVGKDGNLGNVAFAHLAHHVIDVVVQGAGHRPTGHHVRDAHPAEPFSPVVDDAKHVALAEDTDQTSALI